MPILCVFYCGSNLNLLRRKIKLREKPEAKKREVAAIPAFPCWVFGFYLLSPGKLIFVSVCKCGSK